MMYLKTIRKGERAAVWGRKGDVTIVDGPRRLFLWQKTMQLLPQYAAGPDAYLKITYRDGRCEHRPGPTTEWLDPVEHERIDVQAALDINAHEAVVIYNNHAEQQVDRRILRGPARYVPAPN